MTEFVKGQRLLDRYVLLEPLGRVGQGEVWRALDERRSVQVALKILPAEHLRDLQAQFDLARTAGGRGVLGHDEPVGDESLAAMSMELAAADARSLRAKSWTQSLGLLREVLVNALR